MAGSRLDNHVLHLRLSSRPALRDNEQTMAPVAWETAAANGKPAKGSKLLVRNVPFEANKRELRDLFSGFGQLKTLRLPKKIDGTHRGFDSEMMLVSLKDKQLVKMAFIFLG